MKKKITIDGMHCASCASNIERSLKKVSGVNDVSISLITKKAIVQIDEGVLDEDLKRAVMRAGYKVISIE